MRPAEPGKPDGPDENLYRPLAEVNAALAKRLIERYGEVWLPRAGLPARRLPEVGDTVDLLVRNDDDECILRLTSWYTGSTYWMYDWEGDPDSALAWIADMAELQADNTKGDRGRYGPTPWDEE
jgi:hypothetical protein